VHSSRVLDRARGARTAAATLEAVTTTTKPEIRYGPGGVSFEECEHLVSDDDPDTALCGVDQTDVPWNQGLPPCQACMAVAQGRLS
jgi:hypothetical protein